jgi:thiamine-phosphate pyrophosphorylase
MSETKKHMTRMRRFNEAGLYLVTSQAMSAGRRTEQIVASALSAGVRLVQLREKEMPVAAFLELARRIRHLTGQAGALMIVNDRIDVALAVDADGVHLGQDDFPIAEARRLAPDWILGASSHSVEEAMAAQEAGASYVNIGPLFPTRTKQWGSEFLGLEGLDRIAPVLRLPFTVMGGIKAGHIADLAAHGARTMAVVTAVTAAPDPAGAAADLLARIAAGRTREEPCRCARTMS